MRRQITTYAVAEIREKKKKKNFLTLQHKLTALLKTPPIASSF